MKISYAIPVCNEHKEIKRLLDYLIKHKRVEDEIIIQCDQNNTTPKVYEVLMGYKNIFKIIEFPLNGDFATFKNNLKDSCTGDYIFQIDADEYPNEYLVNLLPSILKNNPQIDIFWLPRINTVKGLTQKHVQNWGWRVDPQNRINFPDWQCRILKNQESIKWVNKVHERLTGYIVEAKFPADEDHCLYHPKNIKKQEKQNEFYNTI